MTTILTTGACLGALSMCAGVYLVRNADNPPAANIGFIWTAVGAALIVLVCIVRIGRML